jgi:hypothetical protein
MIAEKEHLRIARNNFLCGVAIGIMFATLILIF